MNQKDYPNKIIQGDTLTVLKTLPSDIVDMGVTSPPYNKGENKKGWLVTNVKYSGTTDKLSEEVYQKNQIEVLNEIFRITKPGGSFFYNHKIRWEKGEMFHPIDWLRKIKWLIRQEIVWDRMIAANIRGWRFWQVEERIYWLYKPVGKSLIGEELKPKHALLTSIWRFPPERRNPHPAPFPLALPVRAIYSIMDVKKGLIIDPYCGSGTTLVAAKVLGQDSIGIEISKEYISFAQKRLHNCNNETKYVEDEKMRHVVEKTFKERKEKQEFTGRYRKGNVKIDNSQPVLFNYD
ncbi:MAG: site-specific DNA-methyltransferase [Elusimicrobia bacterium]|nr:site-specific DNA-methyltransferase [Elusimicrobiota bacterium]